MGINLKFIPFFTFPIHPSFSVPQGIINENLIYIWKVILMKYDIFICHASEDKDGFVNKLANELDKYLSVWYDDFVMRIGDEIKATIYKGLQNSCFGIVVLSPSFNEKLEKQDKDKNWIKYELENLEKIDGKISVLPIVHGFDLKKNNEDLKWLEGKKYLSSDEGIPKIIDEILRVVMKPEQRVPYERRFDPLLHSELDLFGKLLKMRKLVIPYLRSIKNTPYAQQSEDHAREVLSLVYELFYPILESKFNKKELFILAALCLVHDVGMNPNVGMSPKKHLTDEEVFANHCQSSCDFVYHYLFENRVIDSKTADILGRLCRVHNMPIDKAKSNLLPLEEESKLSLTLLYGLFKIADMLEIQMQPGSILRMSPGKITECFIGDFDINAIEQTIKLFASPDGNINYFNTYVSILKDRFIELEKESNGLIKYEVITKIYF